MKIDRKIPCVKCAARLLTVEDAERALDHAAAVIALVQSQEPARFGQAADEWFERYGDDEKVARK